MRFIFFLLLALSLATSAKAAVTVEGHVLYKGIYEQHDCKFKEESPDTKKIRAYNPCLTKANIYYPEIKGLTNSTIQSELNARFKNGAENAGTFGVSTDSLKGMKKVSKKTNDLIGWLEYSYNITYQSPQLIGFQFSFGEYSGGAHGNGYKNTEIIELETGKTLSARDLFPDKDLAAINQFIYEQLSAMPRVNHTPLSDMKGHFIENGKCTSCSFILTADGVKVIFEMYAFVDTASGMPEVLIPSKFIKYPAIIEALKEQKTKDK